MRLGIRELIFLLLMMALVGSSYYFVFKPAADRRSAREAEIAKKQKELVDLRQATAGITDVEQKIEELESAIQFFESKLPQEKEVDKILKGVWELAEKHSLQTRSIKTLKSENLGGYSEQPIQLSLTGETFGFHAFLKELETLSRIIRVSQMKLEKLQNRDGEVQAQMTLSIFFESGSGDRAPVASAR